MKKYTFKFVCDKCGFVDYVVSPMSVEKECPNGCGGTSHAASTPVKVTENGKRR
jgi:hypothetical protein